MSVGTSCFYCGLHPALPDQRFCEECGREMGENIIVFLTSTIEAVERMVSDGEKRLADPEKYSLDKDNKLREGLLLMVNNLRQRKEMLEQELKRLIT